jgi:hypothetical protein
VEIPFFYKKATIYYDKYIREVVFNSQKEKKIMKRIMVFTFTLLTTLPIVNAITTFESCSAAQNLLSVNVSPDPLVPGGYSTFTVSGELSKATSNAVLGILFLDTNGRLIGKVLSTDVCVINNGCPVTFLSGEIGKVYVPAVLPLPHTISVIVGERTAKSANEALGCAIALVR